MSESSHHAKVKTPLLGDTTYDKLKHTVVLAFPALGALYFALAQVWNLPHPEQVVGTIAAVNTFLGLLVNAAKKSYDNSDTKYAGDVAFEAVDGDETTKRMVAHLNTHPQVIASMDTALFRVKG